MASLYNKAITEDDFKSLQSLTDMKNMVERINERLVELEKQMDKSGYYPLAKEEQLIDRKKYFLERMIKQIEDFNKVDA